MTTYYCHTIEEAMRRAKKVVKVAKPGVYLGGMTLRSGRRGFAVYKDGKIRERYSVMEKSGKGL